MAEPDDTADDDIDEDRIAEGLRHAGRPDATAEDEGGDRGSPGLSPEVAAELDELVTRLGAGRLEFQDQYQEDQAARPKDYAAMRTRMLARRRDQALKALGAVVAFLESPAFVVARPELARVRGSLHLRDLWDALGDLEAGHPPDLFALPPGQPPKASPSRARWRGRVAAIVEMMVRAGENAESAQTEVARRLEAAGYHTSRGRKSGRGDDTIRRGTVAAWCKRAREEGPDDPHRRARDAMLGSAEATAELYPGRERAFWSASARVAMVGLVTGNPEGPVYLMGIDFLPPGPEK